MRQSDWQAIWQVLGQRMRHEGAPFEIDTVIAEVANHLDVDPDTARSKIHFLLTELDRMPEGQKYFRRKGNAVVPLPEFDALAHDEQTLAAAYPFEL